MSSKDHYGTLKNVLPLLDLMHRFLLPRVTRDMVSIMRQSGVRRVLDVACGTGYTVCRLHRSGIGVVGIDLSPAMLAAASRKTGSCGFVRGDASAMPFREKSFDGAVISLAVHEISPPLRDRIWTEIKRVVKPEGRLFVLDFARLPARRSLYSKAVAQAILAIEKATLKFDPDHWRNSMDFQSTGGLEGWLEQTGSEILVTHGYLGGNIMLAIVSIRLRNN